jgi:Asp-tRNA(Asn)/Glu-tRNA(Gln) amidotransferase A subunit family amidase
MRNPQELFRLSATAANLEFINHRVSVAEFAEATLARIAERDPAVGAWAALDSALVRCRSMLIEERAPLGGVLIGVKDVIDTQDFPTCYGSPIYANHRPARNAPVIDLLEAAGAVIVGKTVTTEFATYQPAGTVNPRDFEHTPGGSSSGSAAAVADCHVPVALGTQTAGSVIRPASFCGIVGFKPTFARYSYDGIKRTSPSLDTLGILARGVEDIQLVSQVLDGPGGSWDAGREAAALPLRIGLCRTPWWDAASDSMKRTVLRAAALLAEAGAYVDDIELPKLFESVSDAHQKLMSFELSQSLAPEWRRHPNLLSPILTRTLEAGRALSTAELQAATRTVHLCRLNLCATFADCDVLLTPAALGAAPRGLNATGDPLFCRAWSAAGTPCLTLPAGMDHHLPLGVQLIADVDADAELLRASAWVETVLRSQVRDAELAPRT